MLVPYPAIIAVRFKMLLQYRAAAWAGFVTQLFWGFIKVMVFAAFFASTRPGSADELPQVVVYVWLGQALLALLPWNVDQEIAEQIRSGGVAYELLRPLDLYSYWFARTLAFRAAPTSLRMLPMLVFTLLVLPLVGLRSGRCRRRQSGSGCVFLLSLLAMLALSTAFTMIMHIRLMWTISGEASIA